MAEQTVEERLSALEAEVARLTAGLAQTPTPEKLSPPWWKDNVGIFKDSPEFEEAMRYGREWRESFRDELVEDDA